MNSKNRSYINNIDSLIESTSLDQVLLHYGLSPSNPGTSEHRMACVFNEGCQAKDYGNLCVKLDAAKRIFCHSCETRGNLLTLLHGLETGRPPTGGKVRGQEFKHAANVLRQIAGQGESTENALPSSNQANTPEIAEPLRPKPTKVEQPIVNVPLRRHEKGAARSLADLYEELIVEPAEMSPEAARYVQSRPWMTPEVMKQWGIGWIPGDGRSLFRKHYMVFTHRNVRGDIVSYSGRDLNFETKLEKWKRAGDASKKKPFKHRFVSGFHRGVELYGGMAERTNEPKVKQSLDRYGLVVVEGMTDVVRLDCLDVAAVGICSNKATQFQVEQIAKFADQVAGGKVTLLPDCDPEGEAGFQALLWELTTRGVKVVLPMTSTSHGGRFAGMQPEDLSEDDWRFIQGQL